jgi:hypothetical protein
MITEPPTENSSQQWRNHLKNVERSGMNGSPKEKEDKLPIVVIVGRCNPVKKGYTARFAENFGRLRRRGALFPLIISYFGDA